MQVLIPHVHLTDVDRTRTIEKALVADMRSGGGRRDVLITNSTVSRPDGSLLAVRIYCPRNRTRAPRPMLFFLHGGSFVSGGLDSEDDRCQTYAIEANCVVSTVDYRLAPEDPFPAGLQDCRIALIELRTQYDRLGVDNERVAVGGLSAGGALASGVAAESGDDGFPPLILQMLLSPVLDASLTTRTARTFVDSPVLTTGILRDMWRLYLGAQWTEGARSYPLHSSPAHEPDLLSLPPTYICTAGHDPLRDEAVEHAQRLMRAGVPVDLRQYARGFHSFDSFPATRLGRAAIRDQVEALQAAFA